jgi:hypothetical protein
VTVRSRREFLLGSTALAAGCWKGANPPFRSAEDLRVQAAADERAAHLRLLDGFRVPATATRTTPKPGRDLLADFPQLKPLGKVAVRLHPRFGEEPAPHQSKLGGRFYWPAGDPWPVSDQFGIPLVPVLQLAAEDAPPGFPFVEHTDVFQLLWTPRDPLSPQIFWRKRGPGRLADPPPAAPIAFPDRIPVPCRVFPERVMEYPPHTVLPRTLREQLPNPDEPVRRGRVCPGTKVGGYPWWPGEPGNTACDTCRWPMDFLAGIASAEWADDSRDRWKPTEEPTDETGFRAAAGLKLPGGAVNVFVCRRCAGWPVRAVTSEKT